MKKIFFAIALAVILIMPSCKKSMTDIKSPSDTNYIAQADKSFETEFIAIWEGINQNYVLWDYDHTDWDARRSAMVELGRKFDQQYKEGTFDWFKSRGEIDNLFSGLIDGHLSIGIFNPYGSGTGDSAYYNVTPSDVLVKKRPEYHRSYKIDEYINVLTSMASSGKVNVSQMKSTTFVDKNKDKHYVYSCVLNNNVAYIHSSDYFLYGMMNYGTNEQCEVILSFLRNAKGLKENGSLKGVILDNRSNGGGYEYDLNYVMTPFMDQPIVTSYDRRKNGLGRYDFGVWTEDKQTTDNVPQGYHVGSLGNSKFVVLQDMHSVSMGEYSAASIQLLPNSFVIGERSHGGFCTLSYDQSCDYTNWSGCVNYGSDKTGHSLFVPYVASKVWDRKNNQFDILEGVGVIPDIECVMDTTAFFNKTNDNQLMRALQFINN